MSTSWTGKFFPLLMAVLLVTTAFFPAVSANATIENSTDAREYSYTFSDIVEAGGGIPASVTTPTVTDTPIPTITESSDSDSFEEEIYSTEAIDPPIADFWVNYNTGNEDLPCQFTDISTNSPTSWSWDFGDGGTSTLQNPSHLYTEPGVYTVSLTVTNSEGSDTETKTNYILVTPNSFPYRINFQPMESECPDGWIYDYGQSYRQMGGKWYGWNVSQEWTTREREINPDQLLDTLCFIQYPDQREWKIAVPDGTYNVTVSIGDPAYSDHHTIAVNGVQYWDDYYLDANEFASMSRDVAVTDGFVRLTNPNADQGYTAINYVIITTVETGSEPPVADFWVNYNTGNEDLPCQFTDISTNSPTSWSWDFGDGGTSTLQNPSHLYTEPGVYTVSLTVTNSEGSDTETKTNYILVTPDSFPYRINFQPSESECPDGWIYDYGQSYRQMGGKWYGWNVSLEWTARDREINPDQLLDTLCFIQYPDQREWKIAVPDGMYNVTVSIGDPASWQYHTIAVNDIQYWDDYYLDANEFASMSRDVAVTDGFVRLTNLNADQGYTMINYIVIDSAVSEPPVADFIANKTHLAEGQAVAFTDTSANSPTSWLWNFGDGGTSTEQNPTHAYQTAGTYTVTLTATNAFGNDTETKTNYITVGSSSQLLDADFTSNVTSGYPPLAVQFTDLSTGTPIAWNWNFGDGTWFNTTNEFERNAAHMYTQAGSYDVRLFVTDASGSDQENKAGYISVSSSELLTITSPLDDTVANGNVTVAGRIGDPAVSSVTLTHNGVSSTIPVQDGNFSTTVNLSAVNTIIVTAVGSGGSPQSVTLLLDGDMLPAAYEQAIGFDPLNADSDCSQWPGDQSGNGVIDGYEIFAGDLPVFAKARIGADPFVTDTDGDGLTDSFELLKLGTFPEEPGMMSMMGEGGPIVAAGTTDDPDGDGLSNLEEQTYGTDPLVADTDKDDLSDADEIAMGTDPCAADTDGDGLADGAEAALGTDPLNPDSNGNGVPDGAEDYWSSEQFLDGTLNLEVFGRGYAVANVSVAAVNYTHLISDEVLVSKVAAIGFGDAVESGTIAIAYDPAHVVDPSRLSVYRFDDDLGTFVGVPSTVDAVSGVVSCAAAGSGKYAVLDSARWDALFAEEESPELLRSAEPYIARVWVNDSQTGEGVGGANVILFCGGDDWEDLETTTRTTGDLKGLTYDYGVYDTNGDQLYHVEKSGYKSRDGWIHFEDDESGVITTSLIHRVDAPTGFLTATSTPSAGVVYYIDNIYYGSWISNLELLEGEHTLTVTALKNPNYGTVTQQIWITRNQNTQIHVNLPPTSSCGDVRVICSEIGAVVSIDGFNVGVIPASGELTETDVASGIREVTVTKEGFAPYSESVTVVAGQTSTVNAVLVPEDLDGDGLPDIYENGYRDGFGNWHAPDPYAVDTDGDGLSDGFEAGESVTDENGNTYFRQRSDPTKADTDDDGLDDLAEFEYGTDPFNPDTDGDGLRDGADPDPLTPAASGAINLAKIGREILAGAVFGETGLPDGSFYWLVGEETASSPYYMVGWIGFSCLPVVGGIADIRDAVQAILNGDPVGAAMNAAGAIPGPGDGIKITGAIACYTGKFPWKARELGILLSKELLGPLPDTIKIQVWDLLFDGAGSRLVRGEIGAGDAAKVIDQGGDLERTLSVIKRADGKVFWLEEGKLGTAKGEILGTVYDGKGGSGWIHIQNNHIYYHGTNDFKKAFGDAYTDENAIKTLIEDGAKYGQKIDDNGVYHYVEPISGKILLLIIGSNGYIVTAYPLRV